MRSLRRALAAIGAAALAGALSPVASAQAPPPPPGNPTPAVYKTPGQGQVVTASNVTISALVASLSSLPEQKLYVIVSGPVNVTQPITATKDPCQEVTVEVSLPKNGDYQVAFRADAPAPVGLDKCKDATVAPRQFRVEVPPKTPAPPQAGSAPAGGGAAGARRTGVKGGKPLVGRLFDNKPVSPGPRQPGAGGAEASASEASEGGFDEKLPYKPGEEAEPTELGVDETSNSSHRSLAFVAGGFLVLAVYMHLWWLKRQAELPLPS